MLEEFSVVTSHVMISSKLLVSWKVAILLIAYFAYGQFEKTIKHLDVKLAFACVMTFQLA